MSRCITCRSIPSDDIHEFLNGGGRLEEPVEEEPVNLE